MQPSFSDPLRRKEMKQTEVLHKRKQRLRASALPPSIPPHSLKAYQLFTLYRSRDGKIMQVTGSNPWSRAPLAVSVNEDRSEPMLKLFHTTPALTATPANVCVAATAAKHKPRRVPPALCVAGSPERLPLRTSGQETREPASGHQGRDED